MPQRNLKIYVENTLYKELTIDTDATGGYSVASVLEIIATDKEAGLLNNIPGYNPDHLTIRVELRNK